MSGLRLIVSLWLYSETNIEEFEQFEYETLEIMAKYGGGLESATRVDASRDSEEPFEVHVVWFPDEEAFAEYQSDERVVALSERRQRLIARTQIWKGSEVNYGI